MERLFKSEKHLKDMQETYNAITSDQDSLKDKKIIDLAKKNRVMQVQCETLKDKAAKAAEFALNLKKENDRPGTGTKNGTYVESPSKTMDSQIGGMSQYAKGKLTETEKRVTKLRNEN